MTTVAIVAGLVPTAIGMGAGSAQRNFLYCGDPRA
jgi:multidrug efflux pump subunit AcrB